MPSCGGSCTSPFYSEAAGAIRWISISRSKFEILAQSDSLGETRRGPCPCAHSRFWLAIASRSTLGILDESSDLLIITQD